MPHRPKRAKKAELKPGDLERDQFRATQFQDQRRQENAARSTLARLRNRKSDLK